MGGKAYCGRAYNMQHHSKAAVYAEKAGVYAKMAGLRADL